MDILQHDHEETQLHNADTQKRREASTTQEPGP